MARTGAPTPFVNKPSDPMRDLLLSAVVAALLALSGCSEYTGELTYVSRDGVSIGVPDYMSETSDLHPDAVLQFSSSYRNMYLLVLRSSADGSFADHNRSALAELLDAEVFDEAHVADSLVVDHDGFDALQFEVLAYEGPHPVYTMGRTIDAGDTHYRVLVWTRAAYRRQAFGEDMKAILASIRILEP